MAAPDEKDQTELEPSIEDDIGEIFDAAERGEEPKDDTAEEDVAAALDSDTETTDEPDESDQDEDGDEEDEADEAEPDDDAKEAESDDDEPEEVVAAPEHWPQDDRDAFAKLDKDARDLVLTQNKRFEQRHQVHAEKVREADALRETFAPYEQQLQLAGLSRVDGIKRLAAVHGLLTNEPVEGLRWVVKNYGNTIRDKSGFLQSLAEEMGVTLAAGQEAEPQIVDPTAKSAIDGLKQQLSTLTKAQNDHQTQAQNVAVQQAQAELNAFVEAKDDAGNLKHPHYERVRMKMHALWQADSSKSLEDLYSDAVMLDPELRQQWVSDQVKVKTEANGKAKRQAKAKKASRNIKGARTGGQVEIDNMSVEDSVRHVAERLGA